MNLVILTNCKSSLLFPQFANRFKQSLTIRQSARAFHNRKVLSKSSCFPSNLHGNSFTFLKREANCSFPFARCPHSSTNENHQSHSDSRFEEKKDKFCFNSAQPYYYTFPLVVGVQDILLSTHNFTGFPWWATIISVTILLRFSITLPLARIQALTLAKTELLQPTINEVIEALKHNITIKGKRTGQSVEEVQTTFRKEARQYTYDIYKRENCNPLKLYFLPWVQLPLWILISLALRNISGFFPKASECTELMPCHQELVTGGCLWFTDLTASDPYFIIPILIGITNLLNIELNTLKRTAPSKKQLILTRVFRFLTVGMVFAASQVPTAMSLYWATSSSYGLLQNIFLLQPSIRRKLGIPKAPSESLTPFKDKIEILRIRLQTFMEIQRKQ